MIDEIERDEWRARMESDLNSVKTDVADIKNSVVGNSRYRQLGLAERMEKVEAWQSNMTLRVMFIAGLVSGGTEAIKILIHTIK